MKIGVFDSGVGGLSVVNAIKNELPEHEILLREDKEHLPYGTRTPEDLLRLVTPIIHEMVSVGCQIIVIACNTVSTNIISNLREIFDLPIVAIEPMVKPAAELTESGVIAVFATPATLASKRYAELKNEYAKNIIVLEPECADWPAMIEHNQIDDKKISERIEEVLDQNADVIVLGCTHYHWIEQKIAAIAGNRAQVLQPEQAVIRQLKRKLEQLA